MSATQKCRNCRSPLRPCKCERAAAEKARRSRVLGKAYRKAPVPKATHRRQPSKVEQEKFEREFGSKERVEWTQQQPSVASGKRPCVNAHVDPGVGLPSGTGRRGDYRWIVPVTEEEHTEMHAHGEKTFQARYGIYLPGKAREHQERWRRHQYTRD